MPWRRIAAAIILGLGMIRGAGPARAAVIDFSQLLGGSNQGYLPGQASSYSLSGITATGWNLTAGQTAPLWVRTQTGDRGIGVCSEGLTGCNTGGDVNELSNQLNKEAIVLTKPGTQTWTSLMVSSMDSGGTGGAEKGRLYWSNTNAFNAAQSVAFQYGTGAGQCNGECDLFQILGRSIRNQFKNADYLMFVNDGPLGTNNDYLIYKAATAACETNCGPTLVITNNAPLLAPEPASLALLGSGMLVLGMTARRRRK